MTLYKNEETRGHEGGTVFTCRGWFKADSNREAEPELGGFRSSCGVGVPTTPGNLSAGFTCNGFSTTGMDVFLVTVMDSISSGSARGEVVGLPVATADARRARSNPSPLGCRVTG